MNTKTRIFRVAMLLRTELEGVKRVAGDAYMDMTFDYFKIGRLEEIEPTFAQIRDTYDGFLTDSACADRIIDILSGGRRLTHGYFETGLESYYRQLLLLTMREPEVKIDNIRLDALPEEVSLRGVIAGNRLKNMIDEEHERISHLTAQEAMGYDDEIIKRHVRRHKDNPNDKVLTGSARVYEGLGKYKVPVRYLSLSRDEIIDKIEEMRFELEHRALIASQSACLYFDMGESPDEAAMEAVKQALIDFRDVIGLPELIYNTVGERYELPTDVSTLDILTHGMRTCPYTNYLRARSGVNVHVGYGIGATLQDARDAALTALEYAKKIASQTEQVYMIGTDGHMASMELAPADDMTADSGRKAETEAKNAHTRSTIIETGVNEIAKKSHLSSSTVFKLLMLLKKQQRTQVDSEWMIKELGMSARMANKVLSSLEKAGYAQISGKSLMNAKGRPSNIYEIRLDLTN